jgi:hypothetical protein
LLSLGYSGIGRNVGRIRLRLRLLGHCGRADEQGAASEQRADDSGTLHSFPFPPSFAFWRLVRAARRRRALHCVTNDLN